MPGPIFYCMEGKTDVDHALALVALERLEQTRPASFAPGEYVAWLCGALPWARNHLNRTPDDPAGARNHLG